jgi:hypothetical protein
MVRSHARVALLVAASVITISAGCKARVGGKCITGRAACSDDRSGLFCGADGTYLAISCSGKEGCRQDGAMVSCDQSIAASGDACTGPGLACASDTRSAFSCQGGRFVLAETCLGPGACRVALDDVVCDNDVAKAGDPCRDDGDYACTADKSAALKCTGKKMVPINTCRGPKQCIIAHPKPMKADFDCDMSIANEDDTCFFEGNEACTPDKKTMLTCKANKYSGPVACPGASGCSATGNGKAFKASCDTDVGGDAG